MALLLVIGLVATGIVADFWDIETSKDNEFVAGTLDLKVDAEVCVVKHTPNGTPIFDCWSETSTDDPNVFHFDVDCLAPYDYGEVTYSLTNDGCVGGWLTINVTPYTEDEGAMPEAETQNDTARGYVGDSTPLDGELDEQLHVWIWLDNATVPGNNEYDLGEKMLLDGKVIAEIPADGSGGGVQDRELDLDYLIPAYSTAYIGFKWLVQDHGWDNNLIMGDSLSFDIEFELLQRKSLGKAGPFTLSDKVHLPQVNKLSLVNICVDVTNTGAVTGSVQVDLDITGDHTYSDSQMVSVIGGQVKNVCFVWQPLTVGNSFITISTPDDVIGPNPIEVVGAPATFDLSNKVHPSSESVVGNPVNICVDVENIGDYAGTKTVTLTITGPSPGGDSRSVTLNPAEKKTECFVWTPGAGGIYAITVSTPDDTIGPQPITIGTMVPGSNWVHEVSFFDAPGQPVRYTDVSTWTSVLMALGVSAVDSSPCPPVPMTPPNMCAQIDVDHGNMGVGPTGVPQRSPTSCPAPLTYDVTTLWASFIHGGEQSYRYIDAWLFMGPLRQEWAYQNYALVSGTNIGKPYVVGNSWTYDVYSAALPGYYPGAPATMCLSSWN